jgi:hypothetical protein
MMGIAEKTPLHNAMRFRVSYDNPDLDNLVFNINVQKNACQIVDKDVWEWLQKAVKDFIKVKVKPLNIQYRSSTSTKGRTSSIRPSGKKLPISVDRNKYVANHALTQRLCKLDVTRLNGASAVVILNESDSYAFGIPIPMAVNCLNRAIFCLNTDSASCCHFLRSCRDKVVRISRLPCASMVA